MTRTLSWAFVIGVCLLMVVAYVVAVIACPVIIVWQAVEKRIRTGKISES